MLPLTCALTEPACALEQELNPQAFYARDNTLATELHWTRLENFWKHQSSLSLAKHKTQEVVKERARYKFQSPMLLYLFFMSCLKQVLNFNCTHVKQCLQTNTRRDQSQNMSTSQLDELYYFNHYLATSLNTYGERGKA